MSSRHSHCGSYRQPLFEGPVQVKSSHQEWRKRYLKTFCGISEGEPAKLIVYKDKISTLDAKSVIKEILFTNVKRINYTKDRDRRIIDIELVSQDRDQFSFYAESSFSDFTIWFKYCGFLRTIPCYPIPDVPQENLIPQQAMNQYTDPKKFNAKFIWVVHILVEGIAESNTTLAGLCVIAIRGSDATFNVHDFHTGKNLLSWDRGAIRRSGCMKSLVFLEAGRRCTGGPGLLWMYHPISQAMTLRKSLQDFLYYGPESVTQPRATIQISCDAPTSKSYLDDEMFDSFPPSHEDRHRDLPSAAVSNMRIQPLPPLFEYNFHGAPDSQRAGNKSVSSQASADSQCSSGYYSENSSLSDCRNDAFLSNTSKPLYPKGTCKLLRCNEKKHRGSSSSTEDDRCPSTLKHSKYHCTSTKSCTHSYQNCFTHSSTTNNYENASSLNTSDAPPLPPKPTKKKTPIYENQSTSTLFSKASSSSSKHHRRQHEQNLSCEPPPHMPERSNRSYSDSEASSLPPTLPKNQMELIALQRCSPIIVEKLNIPAIIPHLLAKEMLTYRDTQIMLNQCNPDVDKATHLICFVLPRQGDGFFEKFLLCLCESKLGTGHSDIVKSLTATLSEVKGTISGPGRPASVETIS